MIVTTPKGDIVLAASIRELRADCWTKFHQAWAREIGADGTVYGTDSHLSRLGMFIGAKNLEAIQGEFNNLLLNLKNMTSPEPQHMQAAILAPLVVSINGKAHHDVSESGLAATAAAVLATGITQGKLQEACEQSKKNFRPN
jgi:hypothetical protein